MKRSIKIALPLSAIAIAIASSGAFANIDPTSPLPGNTLKVSGSSAVDRTMFEALMDPTNGVCAEGSTGGTAETTATATVLTSAANFNSFGNFMVVCTTRAAATGVPAGTLIAVKKFSGGSETGLDPVGNGTSSITVDGVTTNLNFVNPAASCSSSSFVAATPAPADRVSYRLFVGCGTAAEIPQAGSSDVNPELFGTSSLVRGRLSWQAAHSIPFQLLVSTKMFRDLQVAQGLGACGTLATDATDACMPSISSGQVRALLSGNVSSPSSVFGATNPTPTGGTDWQGNAIDGTVIALCSRNKLSGTRKSFEAMFFGQGCNASVNLALQTDASVTNSSGQACDIGGCTWNDASPLLSAGTLVFEGSGTGEVEKCVSYASGKSFWAIGLASADRYGDDSAGKAYRAVKIDGIAPSLANVMSQKYQYFTENVFAIPKSGSPNFTCNVGTNEGVGCGIRTAIYNNVLLAPIRTPVVLAKTHNAAPPYGRVGVLVRPNLTQAPATTDTPSVRPINPLVRLPNLTTQSSTSNPVNNCNQVTAPGGGSGFLRN